MEKKLAYVFLAQGFEEIEALTPIDVLRRANIEVCLVSVTSSLMVGGAHGIVVKADVLMGDVTDFGNAHLMVLPGGMPGTNNLAASGVSDVLKLHLRMGKLVGAICAAPSILGDMGVLDGHSATCYPGYESRLKGAVASSNQVVVSLPFITANGAGASFEFAFELVAQLVDRPFAVALAKKMMYSFNL
jgi:4-methyl-5(b-hydroxyethyl)-thiazole monophosphate biosynthesis